jgi:hypothetical protein
VFGSDSFREVADPKKQGNPEFQVAFTSNPAPELRIIDPSFRSDPLPDSTDVINNTKIEFIFDRVMRTDCPGKLYLYETAATDILLRTYNMGVDIESKVYSSDLTKFTIDTLGLLKANTNYYVISDGIVFRDWDNMAYPAFAAGDYTFTTDQSTDQFPDLISFVMSSGTLSGTFIRYRNPGDTTINAVATLTAPENWRLRRYQSNFDNVVSNQTAGLTYANATTNTTISSAFEFVDIFLTYANAGGQSNLVYNATLASIIGVIKQYLSSISATAAISSTPYRIRPFDLNVASSFTQAIEAIYGVLQTTRGAETYSTNTTTTISNGPRFEAKVLNTRTGNGFLTYTMTVTPDDVNAVSSLSLAQLHYERLQTLSRRTTQALITEQNYIISDDGNIFVIPPYAILSPAFEQIIGDATVYKKVDGYWQLIQTIDTLANQTSIALSGDGTTLAISNTYEGPVKIYRWSDIYNEFSLEATIGPSTYTQFGQAMSLSYDGNTLAVGEPGTFADPIIAGNAYVYTRSGSTWTLETTLTKTGSDSKPLYGWRVSLSNDGNTLAVGSPQDKGGTANEVGAVYIYTRSGSTWTLQQKIQDTVAPVGIRWGNNLDLSSDGNTFVTNNGSSSVIYTRSGSTWSLQTTIFGQSGSTINLANNGNTVIFSGGIVYTRTGTTWTQKVISALSGFGGVGSAISENENVILTSSLTATGGSDDGYSQVNIFTAVTASFNNSTKTLTFTGSRAYCRTQTDLIQYTPTTGYTGNFNLIYTGTVPDGRSTTRTQAVTRV